ncbi:hypothetical protein WS98_21330 [Burkholderia territorii]|uniref:PIN domain-containing protein n=1 Tax=Burkholderia territorii TaxID=1503055 RepID=UPI00075574C3|nr:PIN domain-containing protein [Burkholderia territorii]KVL32092.1 hypothetical protein WS98_21330 [Burkholderia territorii]
MSDQEPNIDSRIVSLIVANQVGAIALDTSVFDAQQRNLESGLLRCVEQFRSNERIRVLIPDIVRREVRAHPARDVAEASTGLQRAVQMVVKARLLSGDAALQFQIANHQTDEPALAAERRMVDWLAPTRAEVLDVAARTDMRVLFDRYFAAQAPFAESSKKKQDFPDAAALLALEHWANEKETAVLVVSTDSDWQRFCVAHPRLIWTDNLSGPLGAFQDESTQLVVRCLAESLVGGNVPALKDAMLAAGQNFVHEIVLLVDAHSAFDLACRHQM